MMRWFCKRNMSDITAPVADFLSGTELELRHLFPYFLFINFLRPYRLCMPLLLLLESSLVVQLF
jgi:hypothetical protein